MQDDVCLYTYCRYKDLCSQDDIVILYHGHNNDVVAALMLYMSLRRTDVCYIVARLMFVYGGVT